MRARKIRDALARKGLVAADINYDRTAITPSGYSPGWYVELDEDSEQALIDAGWEGEFSSDASTIDGVLAWIAGMPNARSAGGEG